MQSGLNAYTMPEKLWGACSLAAVHDKAEHKFLIASCNAKSDNEVHSVVFYEDSNRVTLKKSYKVGPVVNAMQTSPYNDTQVVASVGSQIQLFKLPEDSDQPIVMGKVECHALPNSLLWEDQEAIPGKEATFIIVGCDTGLFKWDLQANKLQQIVTVELNCAKLDPHNPYQVAMAVGEQI